MANIERILINFIFQIHSYRKEAYLQSDLSHCRINMSFFRIEDPKKRDALVAEYTATIKRIKDRNLQERLGSLVHQEKLQKTFTPLIESNKETSAAITNELKPMKEELRDLNKQIKNIKDEKPDVLLEGDSTRPDMYFGIQEDEHGNYILGDKIIEVDRDRNIRIAGVVYNGTHGLWSLIMDINPKRYTKEDYENYKKIVLQTDLINNPQGMNPNSRPKQTNKYKNYLVNIQEEHQNIKDEEEEEGKEEQEQEEKDEYKHEEQDEEDFKGEGVVSFLPSTIKGLFEKFKLLVAEFIAGNTTTRNELVAILDQLQRRSLISEKEYTTINSLLAK